MQAITLNCCTILWSNASYELCIVTCSIIILEIKYWYTNTCSTIILVFKLLEYSYGIKYFSPCLYKSHCLFILMRWLGANNWALCAATSWGRQAGRLGWLGCPGTPNYDPYNDMDRQFGHSVSHPNKTDASQLHRHTHNWTHNPVLRIQIHRQHVTRLRNQVF